MGFACQKIRNMPVIYGSVFKGLAGQFVSKL
jgi:hypothetical protein